MKKLGFGLMRLPLLDPSVATSVDMEQLKQMVDLFLERGFTYFDTAWMYTGFASENAAKEVLVDRHPRDSFTLTTKLHAGFFDSLEDRDKIFNAQLEKTGAGFFDYYLLHDVEANTYPKFEKYDCFTWLQEKKRAGLVHHMGFSFHDTPELLDEVLTAHPEMEFVQLQLNYLDWESPWIQSRRNYEVCVKHGKPVIVMEPVKGGSLAKVPAEAEALFRAAEPELSIPSWGIRFAASQPNVMMVLSGMSTLQQMEDNTSFMEHFQPLNEEKLALCHRAAEIINAQIAVPCTGCSYCTEGCPMHIAIPKYFSLYNEIKREDMKQKGWTVSFTQYDVLTQDFGRAGDCIACGQCEGICPQHLPIIEHLKQVSECFDHE